MNLTIDQGNTAVKVGLFDGDNLVQCKRYSSLSVADLEQLFAEYPVKAAIVSSVGNLTKLPIDALERMAPKFVRLSSETPIPLVNKYGTPKTLGVDRLASCVGANALLPETNLLVVDMGTCITIDVVTAAGEFLGGNISPGMAMRFKALNQFTNALPLVEPTGSVPLYGNNTRDAILAGVVQAITFELEGYLRNLMPLYPNLSLYLTGGDAFFFEKRLKSSIFVNPNLLLVGLNRILQLNA
ncbi:MAG: type III pantothenate kinase [Paludibacteraceae bacterium]|nr:type III pantothenate kinase [Paludibacteraceae bacterium]